MERKRVPDDAYDLGPIAKIVRGDNCRKTRLHDEKGNIVPFANLLHLPKAAIGWLVYKFAGVPPRMPWISYSAISQIERLMQPEWNVAEFGSGLSTLWFKDRCGYLLSREDNTDWYEMTEESLRQEGAGNVVYELRQDTDYEDLNSYDDGFFDLCFVDGVRRLQCVQSAIPKIKKGGYLYLDNSDVHRDPERKEAERLMLEAAEKSGGVVEFYVDFAPGQLHANEGLLVQI